VQAPQRERRRAADGLLAAAFLVVYLTVNVATLHRYGITADEPEHWFFGDRYYRFYLTFDPNLLEFSSAWWPPTQTWPVGPTLAALTADLFADRLKLLDNNDGHHVASVILFGLLLSSLFLFLTVHAGRTVAVLSCLALAFQPRIWGEAHNNSQDIAHLVFYTLAILTFLHGLLSQRARWLVASALCWGLALGSKINAVSLPLVLAPMLVSVARHPGQYPSNVKRSLVAYPVIAVSVLFLAWPYFWLSPVDRLSRFLSYLVHWGYAGRSALQGAPILNVLVTTPLPILVLGLFGIIASARAGRPFETRVTLVLLAWLLVPIARSSLPGVLNYDVIRRFMEFSPALAIFAGIGGASLMERRGWVARTAVAALLLLPGLALWRYFPYETSYYNLLVGGLGGAQALKLEQSTDYWLSSYREGVDWVNAHGDPGSFVIIRHHPHFVPNYQIRSDLVVTRHLRMDELPSLGRAVYMMYVPADPYDYNMCLAEAFLRPVYEIRRDGGVILRIYRLAAGSPPVVTRDAFPPAEEFSATARGRWVTFRWKPHPAGDAIGQIVYYGRAPGQPEACVCFRDNPDGVEIFAGVVQGHYYLSLSVLTRQAQESERTAEIRQELID